MFQENQDYDMFLDIDDNDVFIRKYSNDNIAIYNKRLSPSPDIIKTNNYVNDYDSEYDSEYDIEDKYMYHKNNTHIIDVSSRVKLLYILFAIIMYYAYHLVTSIYVIIK
jgi:hypothetical protein